MRTKVLDHGYIELIEHWGSDERIIEAARMSTAKGFQGWGPIHDSSCAKMAFGIESDPQEECTCRLKHGDEKLLRYLWEHKHATPFEMAGAVVEVQAPIFVFREWHRHRTQSYNELSARYTPMPDVNYVPTTKRLLAHADGTNKQAGRVDGAGALTSDAAEKVVFDLQWAYAQAELTYQKWLKAGVPKELARLVIPVGRYSRMRASANLRNWLAFLTLRMDAGAQWEIRQYANALHDILSEKFPRTLELFDEGATR